MIKIKIINEHWCIINLKIIKSDHTLCNQENNYRKNLSLVNMPMYTKQTLYLR
jgi:hypothetical protein